MIDRPGVKAALDAFSSGDPDLVVPHVDPEFEGVVPPNMSAEPDSYVGHAGVRRYIETFQEIVDELGLEWHILEEVGDWILCALRITGLGRTSGIPVDNQVVAAIQMRDGKLLR